MPELLKYSPDEWEEVPLGVLSVPTGLPVGFDPNEWEELPMGASIQPPAEKEEPGMLGTIGRGLTHGIIGLGESIGAGTQWLGERIGSETVAKAGEIASNYYEKVAEPFGPPESIAGKNVIDDPGLLADATYWLYNVPEMLPAFGAAIASSLFMPEITVAKNAPKIISSLAKLSKYFPAFVTGGGLEAAQTYKQTLKSGASEESAARSAELMFLGAGVLNAIGTGKILEAAGAGFKGRVLKTLGAGVWEGITEGLEEPTEVFSKYIGKYLAGEKLPNDLKAQLLESLKSAATVAPIAAVTGFGGSTLGGTRVGKPTIDEVDTFKKAVDSGEFEKGITGGDITPEIVEDIATNIEKTDAELADKVRSFLTKPETPEGYEEIAPIESVSPEFQEMRRAKKEEADKSFEELQRRINVLNLKKGRALTDEELLQERVAVLAEKEPSRIEQAVDAFEELPMTEGMKREVLMRKFQPSPKEVSAGKEQILAKVQEVKDQKLQARTITEGIFGTKEGQAFKNKGSASLNKVRMEKDHGVEFEPVEVEGGWGLQRKEVAPEKAEAVKEPNLNQPISANKGNIRAWFKEPKNWENKERLTYKEVVEQIAKDKSIEIRKTEKAIDPSRPLGDIETKYSIYVDGKYARDLPEFAYKYYEKVAKPQPTAIPAEAKPEAAGLTIEGKAIPEAKAKAWKIEFDKTYKKSEFTEAERWDEFKAFSQKSYADDFPISEHFEMWMKKPAPKEAKAEVAEKTEGKVEIETTPEGKEVTVDLTKKEETALTPKQQKEYLLAEIDKAIESGLKEAGFDNTMEVAKELLKKNINALHGVETVYIFEVPNDGTFEIVGSQLFEFQKQVTKTFPSTIISPKFKPSAPPKKAVPAAKYKNIIDRAYGVTSEKLKPENIDGLFESVADTEVRGTDRAIHLNAFQNWLLSQDITQSVRDRIRSVAGKDYIEEARVKIETQDLGYAMSMVEHRREAAYELQDYVDSYKAKTLTLGQINKETGIKRSGRELEVALSDANHDYTVALKHLRELEEAKEAKPAEKPTERINKDTIILKAKDTPRKTSDIPGVYLSADKKYAGAYANGEVKAAHQRGTLTPENGAIIEVKIDSEESIGFGDVMQSLEKDDVYDLLIESGVDEETAERLSTEPKDAADYIDVASGTSWMQRGMGYDEVFRNNIKWGDIVKIEIFKDGKLDKTIKGGAEIEAGEITFYTGTPYTEHLEVLEAKPAEKPAGERKPYEVAGREAEAKEAVPSPEGRVDYTKGRAETEYPEIVSDRAGSYESGVKTIVAPQDAAAFAHLNLSKYPQEHLATLILDKDHKIISVHRYSIGTAGRSFATPSILAGHALNTPDAASIIIVHNHPSGDPFLSKADDMVFRALKNTLKGTKVKAHDMIAVGVNEYSSYMEGSPARQTIPEVKAKYEIPMVERVFKQKGKNLYRLSFPQEVKDFGKNNLPEGGLILLNNANDAVGTLPISDYSRLREGMSETILKQVDATNAISIIAYNSNIEIPALDKTNLKKFANATGLKLLDVIDSKGSWQEQGLMPVTEDEIFYSTKQQISDSEITLSQVRNLFKSPSGLSKDGNIWVRLSSGYGFQVKSVQHISENKLAFETARGRMRLDGEMIAGKFEDDTIEIVRGIGDKWTLYHESEHMVEKAGLITPFEINVLKRKIKSLTEQGKFKTQNEKDIGGQEDRAYFIETELNKRSSYAGTVQRILNKIADWIDSLVNLFTATSRGVTRAFESGKIFQRKAGAETSGINQFAQDVSFSLKKAVANIRDNPKFNRWFKKSQVVDEYGNPLPVYHGTKAIIDRFKHDEKRFDDRLIFFTKSADFAEEWARGRQANKPPRNYSWTEQDQKKLDDHWKDFHKISDELYKTDKAKWTEKYDKLKATEPRRKYTEEREADVSIYPVYISAQNIFNPVEDYKAIEPLLKTMEGMQGVIEKGLHKEGNWLIYENKTVIDWLESKGYDGVYIKESAFTGAPHDTIAVWNPTQIKSIFNTEFDPTNPDIRYAMAGEKAIGAPTGALAKAQEMLAEGKSEKEVWKETGWLKGAEGKWKWEIDDSGAKLKDLGLGKQIHKLGDVLDHKKLYDSYPQLKEIRIHSNLDPKDTWGSGSYFHGEGLEGEILSRNRIMLDGNPNKAEEFLFHEIAHAIQNISGFAKGGSPEIASADAVMPYDNTMRDFQKQIDDLAFDKGLDWDSPEVKDIRDKREEYTKTFLIKKYGEDFGMEMYHNLAGEIEARDTAARAKLTAEERRETMPYEAQGIPREDWIVTDGKGTSFSIELKEAPKFATKELKAYNEQHATPLVDDLINRTKTDNLDAVKSDPDETKSFIRDVRESVGKATGRFSSEVISIRDMKWYHVALETPYVLAKKFKSMNSAVKTEIKRHESRAKKLFKYYHGELDVLQKHMQKNPEDLKAYEDLIWKWEDKRMPESEVPTDWYSIEDGDLKINPRHYVEVRNYLKKQGVKDAVADGFITIRKILDNVLVEADSVMKGSNVDESDLQEFRKSIGKTHNYFSHTRDGDAYIRIKDKNTGKTVYREHFYKIKERLLPLNKMAKARTISWLKEQLSSGELKGSMSDYDISPAREVTKLPDEIFFQIPVEALSQISMEAGKGLAASRTHYEALRLMKKEGLSEKEAHAKANKILTADMERHLARAIADVLKTRGWGAHAIARQGTPGFKTTDTFDTLFQYLSGYSGFITKIEATKEHSKTLQAMNAKQTPNEYRYTSDYIRDMLANTDKTDQMVDRLRGIFFVKYLGGVVKSGIVNLTQNVVMAGPILSQYTKGSHFKLAKAMRDVRKAVTGKNAWMGKETQYGQLAENEQRALTEMVETGAAQDLFLRELKGEIPGTGWGKYVKKVIDKSGIFMQVAEKFNRASTGLAAYRIAFNEGVTFEEKQTKGDHNLSVEFTKKAIYDSHFLYGKSNLPAAFRGGDFRKVARATYTFRSFTHNYLDIMADLVANQGTQGLKVAGRSLINIMALGGLTSIPFFTALSSVIMSAMGDDDEDALTKIRGMMPNKFMQDMMVYGLSGAVGGVDLSGSLSIEVPRNFKDIIGVPYAIYEDSMNMVKSIKSGNQYRAVAETPFTPIAVRNAMRGIELYTRGQRTRGGKAINVPGKKEPRKITSVEAVKKTVLGLQPIEVSSGYKAYQATQKMKSEIRDKKTAWADRYANAKIDKDLKEMIKIKKEVREWNTKARKEKKFWRIVDIDKMVESRLEGGKIKGIPKSMRKESKERYAAWQ